MPSRALIGRVRNHDDDVVTDLLLIIAHFLDRSSVGVGARGHVRSHDESLKKGCVGGGKVDRVEVLFVGACV